MPEILCQVGFTRRGTALQTNRVWIDRQDVMSHNAPSSAPRVIGHRTNSHS